MINRVNPARAAPGSDKMRVSAPANSDINQPASMPLFSEALFRQTLLRNTGFGQLQVLHRTTLAPDRSPDHDGSAQQQARRDRAAHKHGWVAIGDRQRLPERLLERMPENQPEQQ